MGNKNNLSSTNQVTDKALNEKQHTAIDDNTAARSAAETYERRAERRSTPRSKTIFYRIMLGLNISAWVGLVVVLVLFHYARPDFISGVQEYWGIEGDTSWSERHLFAMSALLLICLCLSLVSLVMRAKQSRRQRDQFGVNIFVLLAIVAISLITLATTLGLF